MGYAAEKINEIDEFGAPAAIAPVVPLRPHREAERAVLAFPAALLPLLPVPVTLELEGVGGQRFSVVLDDERAVERRSRGEAVLDAQDWERLVLGVESDRLRANDLAGLLVLRRERPLTDADVLAGANADPPRGFSTARVLARLGVAVRTCIARDRDVRGAA